MKDKVGSTLTKVVAFTHPPRYGPVITLTAQFTMKPGEVGLALRRVEAVKRQTEKEQPGTLFYLVHRVLDARKRPTRTLLFYESYRDQKALDAHLAGSSWKALIAGWSECFEGSPKDIDVTGLQRIAGIVRLEAP
jgi:quinol monooxygenase YgiN